MEYQLADEIDGNFCEKFEFSEKFESLEWTDDVIKTIFATAIISMENENSYAV